MPNLSARGAWPPRASAVDSDGYALGVPPRSRRSIDPSVTSAVWCQTSTCSWETV